MWNDGFEYAERLGAQAAGQTLLSYLSDRYRHSTPEQWRERIASGQVRIDGAFCVSDAMLRCGQRLAWRRPGWEEHGALASFALLYRDDAVLGVAKPSGLATIPGGGFLRLTLLHAVRARFPEAAPLHRLGRGTSGVVIFGRTPQARSGLSAQWHAESFVKTYRALISGTPAWDKLEIDAPIGPIRHAILGRIHGASAEGKPALSRVTVLQRGTDVSLVQVQIHTGRPHQIRIHLAAAGHPLWGDPLYGEGGIPKPDSRALPGDLGYFLHAERLQFLHPVTGSPVVIDCSPPPALRLEGGKPEAGSGRR